MSSAFAWGRVRDEGTTAERLAARSHDGSDTIEDPDWIAQAREIVRRWTAFRVECARAGLPAYFVCEDFLLTRFKSSDRSGLYPVWVAAAIAGYRNGLADGYELGGFGPAARVEIFWQLPSQAQGYAIDERLKRWGLWVKGREHERDAWRHFAFFVANKDSQSMRATRMRVHTWRAAL